MVINPSQAALALLKEFEQGPHGGFAADPYTCPAGKKTVGWGRVVRSDDRFTYPLTAEDADRILRSDLKRLAGLMTSAINTTIRQCMADALFCFVFDVEFCAFVGSTLLTKLNRADYIGAADQFLLWNKARDQKTGDLVELDILTRRRQAERNLFLRDGVVV